MQSPMAHQLMHSIRPITARAILRTFYSNISKSTASCVLSTRGTKPRCRRRTFHEPSLIHRIKPYMKSSASESIRNGYSNLERLMRSFRLAWPGISTWERP